MSALVEHVVVTFLLHCSHTGLNKHRPATVLRSCTATSMRCVWISTWLASLQVPRSQVLVVLDDLDLPIGTVRLRAKGGSAGHNGLKSIAQHFGGQTDFPRLRLGGCSSRLSAPVAPLQQLS